MNPSNQRIEALRRLMQLEERRAVLQIEIDQVFAEIDTLQTQLFTPAMAGRARKRLASFSNNNTSTPPSRRMGRGELRSQILDALRAAGEKGVQVKELASLLRIKPVNIHSWFHSSARRYPEHIRKTGPGRYTLTGSLEFPERPQPANGPRGVQRNNPRRARARRGEVTRQILGVLTAAGTEGASVQDIASKIGTNYRSIHVWFSSTGKKNPQIIKIGRGRFGLLQPPVQAPV